MDIQAQVAARRRELARVAREEEAKGRIDAAAVREEAENRLAAEQAGFQGSKDTAPLPEMPTAIRRTELAKLLKREAKKAWTPSEHAVVIGGIVLGLIIAIGGSWTGWLLVVGAAAIGYFLNDKHRREVLADHPTLFAEVSDMTWIDLVRLK